MTTVVKDIGKCTVCGKHKQPEEMGNPLAKKFGICDQCFMHRQRDWEDRNPDTERENLKFKAVMAVSAPKEGETCNCNQGDNSGDHSNANGDQHGMYNQEAGRANWQGQGLPQPKDTCQCDEKPTEANNTPNADARQGKKKGGFTLNYDDWNEGKDAKKKKKVKKDLGECSGVGCKNRAVHPMKVGIELDSGKHVEDWINVCPDCKKKIEDFDDFQKRRSDRSGMVDRAMTPAQLESRKKKRPYRQTDLRRRKYRDKKHRPELFIGDLDEEGKLKESARLGNIVAAKRQKRKLPPRTPNEHEGKRHKYRVREGMEGLTKKLKALEEIIKKRRTRRGKKGGKKGTVAGHTGKWRKTLSPLQFKQPSETDQSMEALASKLSEQDKKQQKLNQTIASNLNQQISSPPPQGNKNPKASGKPSKTAPPTGTKQFRRVRPKRIANTTGALTAAQGLADAANTKRQKEQKDKKQVKENKTPPKKRAQTKVREGMGMFDKALFLAKYRGQKKQTAGEKEKKKLEAKLSPEVEANMKRVNDLKDNVDALGRDKRTQHSTSSTGGGKKGTLKLITPQRKKLQRELLANEKKQKEKEKKEKKVKPKVKPKKSKFPKFGIKAEENQFGAWGQRGLGDGNGTGSIQGSGDTHLISPVKQKELDKLMAGARYMPRSVKRRKD